jgi:peptide/nickel transport system permease protein
MSEIAVAVDRAPVVADRGYGAAALRVFLRNPIALVGAAIILIAVLGALFGPALMPYDPYAPSVSERLQGPSLRHWMGTDRVGRDLFSRVLAGLGLTMQVATGAVVVGAIVGIPLGAIAGFAGRGVDAVLMRVMDAVMAFPSRLLAIALVAARGASMESLWIAIAVSSIPRSARIVRGGVLTHKQRDYVEAARASGESEPSVLFRYVLPNSLPPVTVQGTLDFAHAILVESSLSFLGLGFAPPTISWGLMLSEAQKYMETAPWTAIFPGLAISVVIIGFNLFGDALRDTFDPRQYRR